MYLQILPYELFLFGLLMFVLGALSVFMWGVLVVRGDENSPYPSYDAPYIAGLPQVYYADEVDLVDRVGGDDD